MPNPTILIIDDDQTVLDIAAAALERGGYHVLTAANGEDGLDVIDRETVDGVVLDINMPGMGGHDVLKSIRESKTAAELPVMMLTVESATSEISQSIQEGANDYMIKPFTPDSLEQRVQGLFEG